jgi:hypothetical protein
MREWYGMLLFGGLIMLGKLLGVSFGAALFSALIATAGFMFIDLSRISR